METNVIVAPAKSLFYCGTSHRILMVGLAPEHKQHVIDCISSADTSIVFLHDNNDDPTWILDHSTVSSFVITDGDNSPLLTSMLIGLYSANGKVITQTSDNTIKQLCNHVGIYNTTSIEQTIDVVCSQIGIANKYHTTIVNP